MNSMCSIGYCLNAIILCLTIVLDYGAMTTFCQPTQTDETLFTELHLKTCTNSLVVAYSSYVLYYTFVYLVAV